MRADGLVYIPKYIDCFTSDKDYINFAVKCISIGLKAANEDMTYVLTCPITIFISSLINKRIKLEKELKKEIKMEELISIE